MNGARIARRRRSSRLNRTLVVVLAAMVFAGVVMQITMLARISGQRKEQAVVEREIRVLSAQLDNTNLSINSFHNLDRIAARARQLGMEMPDETQLRVVNLPVLAENTSTQSAEAVGAEEIR